MKSIFKILPVFILSFNIVMAQNCDIQIKIYEGKYMFGQATKMENSKPIKEIEVNFSSEVMEVIMQVNGHNYLIKVVNQDCQAYCRKSKRVRQLHSGDEEIVKNLFSDKHDEIVTQIEACDT